MYAMFPVVLFQISSMKKCHPAGSNMADEPSGSSRSIYPMSTLHVTITVALPAVAVTTAIHQAVKQ